MLIDQFISNYQKTERISPSATALTTVETPLFSDQLEEKEDLMTETLARVYLEQKKYDKAIKAFKILSLKYPEKSGFFADRIKAVQFLQQNNS